MPLLPIALFTPLFAAIQTAAEESMLLYNRGLDPCDKEKDIVAMNFLGVELKVSVDTAVQIAQPALNINNKTEQSMGIGTVSKSLGAPNAGQKAPIGTVDMKKASELFGAVFAAKLAPVLTTQIDAYIRTGLVQTTVAPGILTAGSAAAQATTTPGIGTGIMI